MSDAPMPERLGPAPPESAPEGVPFAPAAPPERVPFWGYSDLALLTGLAIPCMIAGWAIVKVFMWTFHLRAAVQAPESVASTLAGYSLLFGALMLMFRVQYGRPFWSSLGWTKSRLPILWSVIFGLATAYLVSFAGKLLSAPQSQGPLVDMMKGPNALILLAIFGTTIAPLCEELLFRGFLQPLLIRSLGVIAGILTVALVFGFLHYSEYGASWRSAVLVSLAGAAFGAVRHISGSTKAAAIMHATFNALSFISMFAQARNLTH